MEQNISKFTLRVNTETLKKFEYVAGYHGRSANKELDFLMRRHIADYERKHEKIVLEEL